MADVVRNRPPGGAEHAEWALTNADAIGEALRIPGGSDKTVQFIGTWGGATVVLEGSNALTPGAGDWSTLHEPDGAEISATADYISFVAENPLWVRPVLSGGAGASIAARLVCLKR